jgi:hypothetical protein
MKNTKVVYLDQKFVEAIKEKSTIFYTKIRNDGHDHDSTLKILLENIILNAIKYFLHKKEIDELIMIMQGHCYELKKHYKI